MNDNLRPLSELGLSETLLEKVLSRALSRGGDFADVFFEDSRLRSLQWEESKLKSSSMVLTRGLGIRVISGEKTGYAYTDEISEEALLHAADTASHIAESSRDFSVSLQTRKSASNFYPLKHPFGEKGAGSMLSYLETLQKAAASFDPKVEKIMAGIGENQREILIANSEGLLVRDFRPMVRCNLSVIAEKDGRRENAYEGIGGRQDLESLTEERLHSLSKRVADLAVRKLDAGEAPAGAMPVVLGAGTGSVLLHEAVGHGLEADFCRKGTSVYSHRIGEKVASELCTVVDDATVLNDRGALNVDDEGQDGERTVLIEKGVLKGYMQDRLSTRLTGDAPTGNGRRESYQDYPMARMTCTYLEPGESEPEEILSSVENGLYAKRLGGGQVDISRGDFVFTVAEGYRIENGKVGELVKGASLIGNGPEVMDRVTMVGNDLAISEGMWTCGKHGQGVPVGQGMPHLKVSEITVGGTSMEGAS